MDPGWGFGQENTLDNTSLRVISGVKPLYQPLYLDHGGPGTEFSYNCCDSQVLFRSWTEVGWSLLAFPMYNSSRIQTLVRVELLVGSSCGLDQIKKIHRCVQ